jgi:RHS repeat-associated protein
MCRRVAFAPGVTPTAPADPCVSRSATAGAAVDTVYFYDARGDQIEVLDAISARSIATSYDPLGRPLLVADGAGAVTSYTYGLTSATRTDASGSYSFSLDWAGRETSMSDPLNPTGDPYAWTYQSFGSPATMTAPNANVTQYGYDALGRLAGQSTTGAPGCPLCSVYTYSYNAAGMLIGAQSTLKVPAAGGGTTPDPTNGAIAYSYDALGRLTGYTPPTGGPTGVTPQSYAWAARPDRTSITKGGTTTTITHDAASRPISDSAGGAHSADADGRITSLPSAAPGVNLTLTYDALGRLTRVHPSSGSDTCYGYDPRDRLDTVTVGCGTSATTSFTYVALSQALAKVTAAGVTTRHVTDLSGVDLAEGDASGTPTYLERNGHGDVTWTADASGALSARATYDPFGNLLNSTGGVPATRWQGSWQDASSGLYYVVARWYSPTLGSFLSVDPEPGDAVSPQSFDPYAYVGGNALGGTDVSGRTCVSTRTVRYDNCTDDEASGPITTVIQAGRRGNRVPSPPVLTRYRPQPPQTGTGPAPISDPYPGPPSTQPEPEPTNGTEVGPTPPTSFILDTTVVGGFNEHYPYYQFCGAGALRVVLAFTSNNPGLGRGSWQGDPDLDGWRYMWYLARQVQPGGASWTGVFGYLPNKKATNFESRIRDAANWEYSLGTTAYQRGYPFNWHATGNKADFVGYTESQLLNRHVPVIVQLWTANPSGTEGLPSWQTGPNRYHSLGKYGGHYVSIVGFDADNFYYVDTCWPHGCNPWGYDWTTSKGLGNRAWRVTKQVMWDMIAGFKGSYLLYFGPPSDRVRG